MRCRQGGPGAVDQDRKQRAREQEADPRHELGHEDGPALERKVQEVLGRPLARLPGRLPEPQRDRQSGSRKNKIVKN